jgi:uncharacterized protein YkwD
MGCCFSLGDENDKYSDVGPTRRYKNLNAKKQSFSSKSNDDLKKETWQTRSKMPRVFKVSQKNKEATTMTRKKISFITPKVQPSVYHIGLKNDDLNANKYSYNTSDDFETKNKQTNKNFRFYRKPVFGKKGNKNEPYSPVAKQKEMEEYQRSFNQQCIQQHNLYRKMHYVEPLELSQDLIELAQEHANFLATNYKHCLSNYLYNDEPLGQNIKMYADTKLEYFTGLAC